MWNTLPMHTLKRLSARLRPNRNRKSPAEPSPVGQDPPLIRTILPTYAGELCATCLEFLAIIKTEPAERVPCPADGAELLELPPLFCPFCYLRWRVMPSEEREKLRGCRDATIKVHPSSVSVVITINYLYPVGAGSYLMALGCQPCMRS
jgi:hypothetical protein